MNHGKAIRLLYLNLVLAVVVYALVLPAATMRTPGALELNQNFMKTAVPIVSNPGTSDDAANAVAEDATGIYVVGHESIAGLDFQWRIEKRNKITGALDTTFGSGTGVVTSNPSAGIDIPLAVVVDATGLYIAGFEWVAGSDWQWRLEKRDRITGNLDTIFGSGTGVVNANFTATLEDSRAIAVDATGLYVVGYDHTSGNYQ